MTSLSKTEDAYDILRRGVSMVLGQVVETVGDWLNNPCRIWARLAVVFLQKRFGLKRAKIRQSVSQSSMFPICLLYTSDAADD